MLFAKVVNAPVCTLIALTNKLEMFMWGDRLLDQKRLGYQNGNRRRSALPRTGDPA